MNSHQKPLPSLPLTTPTLSSLTIDKDPSANDGILNTKDDIGELWTEGRAHRGQVLEYLGMGPGVIDEVLDEMGRAVLPALTTTNSVLEPSIPGVVEDAALAGKDFTAKDKKDERFVSKLATPRLLLHLRIERRQPEPVEDYGFYIVRAATRNRFQNKVKVKFREGIWDGQALFRAEDAANHARAGSSSTAAEIDQVTDTTETEGPYVGGTFIVTTSNPLSDKEIWQSRIRCAIYLHLSLLLEQAFLRGCGVPLVFPSSTPITSPITPPRMTASPIEMESSSSRRNAFIPNSVRSWFGSFGSGIHSRSLGPLSSSKPWGGSLDLTSTKSSEDAPLPRLKRLLSHRHSHSLSVAEEQPSQHVRHRNRTPPTRQSTAHHSMLSTSPNLTFPPSSRLAGVEGWVQMQGLAYLEGEKEEYARFYGHGDRRLWEVVRDLLHTKQDAPCPVTRTWVHASVNVLAEVEVEPAHPSSEDVIIFDEANKEKDRDNEDAELSLCLSCATCGAKSDKKSLGNAGLLSFSKFLELLIYRPPSPTICSCPAPTKIRYNFQGKGKEVRFWRQELGSVYEVRVPRVQVLEGDAPHGGSSFSSKEKDEGEDSLEKVELRREIRAWWEDMGKKLDLLEVDEAERSEDKYSHEWTRSKALPRVPSEWVHYDDAEFEEPAPVDGLPAATPAKDDKTVGYPPATAETKKSISELRESFHRKEQALYTELRRTPVQRLNDVRRGFLKGARGALEELEGRQKVPGKVDKNSVMTVMDDGGTIKSGVEKKSSNPAWWGEKSHVLAGGNVIVKEDDWGSVIAWCLSSPKYQRELETMANPRSPSRPPLRPSSSSSCPPPSSFTSKPTLVSPALSTSTSSSTASFFSAVFRAPALAPEWHLEDHELHVCRKGVGIGLGLVIGVGGMSNRFGSLAGLGKGKIGDEKDGGGRSSLISVGSASVVVSKEERPEAAVAPVLPPKDSLEVPTLATVKEKEREGSFFLNALRSVRLLGDAAGIDERPHVRCDLSVKGVGGTVKKWSVTVYYAREFEELRGRCGVGKGGAGVSAVMGEYVKSLRQTEGWDAQGGKSRAGFWRTVDGQYVIKELVSKWGVADLQVLLSLAPEYFAYINSTSGRDSTMVKMLGVYSVEGPGGERADLVVMENLFYGYASGLKMFDLKGMKSRRSKPVVTSEEDVADGEHKVKEDKHKTLFDGEWIDMQREKTILVDPRSKKMLREAIRRDTEFLTKGNIMDYSLLVGIGEGPERLLVVGLVDTIGSYTFAKTIESKAKQNLPGREKGEVTVIPPKEYEERFVRAVDGYFVRCPDRSTTLDDSVEGELGTVL